MKSIIVRIFDAKVKFMVALSLRIDLIRHLKLRNCVKYLLLCIHESTFFFAFTFSTYFSIKLKSQLFVAFHLNIENAFANNIALCNRLYLFYAICNGNKLLICFSFIFQFRNKMAHKRIAESLS